MAAGDKAYWADVANSIRPPLVRLVQQTAQNLTDTTDTAITFGAGSEDIDTHNFHDTTTNPSRVTPTIPGYYRVTGTLMMPGRADYATVVATIAKNGAVQPPRDRTGPNATTAARSATAQVMLTANGTTDYFELLGLQDNTANAVQATNVGGSFASVLEVEYLSPL